VRGAGIRLRLGKDVDQRHNEGAELGEIEQRKILRARNNRRHVRYYHRVGPRKRRSISRSASSVNLPPMSCK
jgi:hypothetical protein